MNANVILTSKISIDKWVPIRVKHLLCHIVIEVWYTDQEHPPMPGQEKKQC